MKAYQPISSISELVEGDTVRHEGSMVSYLVHGVYGTRASAVRTVDITNPAEWRVLKNVDDTLEPPASNVNNADKFLVLRVTTAYKQGYQHALRHELSNPYEPNTIDADAWDRGRSQGQQTAKEPEAWLHLYRRIGGGRSYQQADLAVPPSYPEPEEGYEWYGARPLVTFDTQLVTNHTATESKSDLTVVIMTPSYPK